MPLKPHLFRFKQFSVDHSRSSVKIGTDAILLGAWASVNDAYTVLDIGTGCGVIALMLAQRTAENVRIHAVEIDRHDADIALENVASSPWKDKVEIFNSSIQNFNPPLIYDCIVSNPPFFSDSFKPFNHQRQQARHTESLPFTELIDSVTGLLSEEGRFSLILPYREGQNFINQASMKGLYVSRQFIFKSRKSKPAERLLLEFRKQIQTPEVGELIMFEGENDWSEDYKKLTKEFFLHL